MQGVQHTDLGGFIYGAVGSYLLKMLRYISLNRFKSKRGGRGRGVGRGEAMYWFIKVKHFIWGELP